MQIRESAEDYLEAILVLKQQNGSVRAIDIAHHLGFSRPSVSIAMKNLRDGGYISVSPDSLISLTEAGAQIAEKVYERHRILTDFLCHLGVPDDIARADACRIEHALSHESFVGIKNFYFDHFSKENNPEK